MQRYSLRIPRFLLPALATSAVPAAVAVLFLLSPKEAGLGTAALAGIAVLFFLLANPERTYLALVFCLPFIGIGVIDVGITITLSKFLGALLILQILVLWIQGRRPLEIPWAPSDKYLVAFWLYALILAAPSTLSLWRVTEMGSVQLRGPWFRSMNQLVVLALLAGIYFGTRVVVRDERMMRRSLQAILAALVLSSVYGLYQVLGYNLGLPFTDIRQYGSAISGVGSTAGFVEEFSGLTRISAFSGEPKGLAVILLPFILAMLSFRGSRLTPWGTGRRNLVFLVLLLVVFTGTYSRAGYILLPLSILVAPLLRGKAGTGRFWLVFILCTIPVVGLGLIGTKVLGVDLLEATALRVGETSVFGFKKMIDHAKLVGVLRLMKSHPVFGVGFGNSTFYLKKVMAEMGWLKTQPVEAAPNVFLSLWAETGVIGLALFSAFCIGSLIHIRRSIARIINRERRELIRGLLCAALAGLVVLLYMPWLSEPYFWFWLGLAQAAAALPQHPATSPVSPSRDPA